MKTDNYSKELLHVFFSQKTIITSVALFVFGVSLLIFLFWPRQYQATGSLLLRGKAVQATPETLLTEETRIQPPKKEDLYSELQLLHSRDLLARVLNRYAASEITPESIAEQTYAEAALSSMTADVLPGTNVIQLTISGHDTQQNVKVLDTVMKEYIQYRMDLYQPAGTLDFLNNQTQKIRNEIEQKNNDLLDLMRQGTSSDPLQELKTNLLLKRDLDEERRKLSNSIIDLKALSNQLLDQLEQNRLQKIQILDNPELNTLFDRAAELKFERNNLLRNYHPGSQAVQIVEKEKATIEKELKEQLIAYIEGLHQQQSVVAQKIDKIENRLQAIDTRNMELRRQQVLADRINLESSALQESYLTFFKRHEDARLKAANNTNQLASYISIMQKPHSSAEPVFPSPMILPIGLISGLLLGAALGYVREFFDHTFKRTVDVERVSRMPVIFYLPEIELDEATLLNRPKKKVFPLFPVD